MRVPPRARIDAGRRPGLLRWLCWASVRRMIGWSVRGLPRLLRPAGYRFPREVIAVAVRWYLRYGLSYRDVEELLAERGIEVDHVTIYRWVQTLTCEFIDASRPARHTAGDRWFVDETYVKVAGRWTYLYRAIDQDGQVIDVLATQRRDRAAAGAFFTRALTCGPAPVEVTTDRAAVYPRVIDELLPAARHVTEQYANNSVEADHGRLKARLRPMRGVKTMRSLRTVTAGHVFVQNLRRGHYEIAVEMHAQDRVRIAFTELARCLKPRPRARPDCNTPSDRSTQHNPSEAPRWASETSPTTSPDHCWRPAASDHAYTANSDEPGKRGESGQLTLLCQASIWWRSAASLWRSESATMGASTRPNAWAARPPGTS